MSPSWGHVLAVTVSTPSHFNPTYIICILVGIIIGFILRGRFG